eukprot:TRINITY_DN42417_c0_g1_i1.p1 TRINITY_DN42417_c0_g1~~TRINITY_DN42417_c0_g1_i1.p1  ORF type:complete len:273 (+),score=51.99 TRINITY_DN42417_c0_g1_i1:98-916(+)
MGQGQINLQRSGDTVQSQDKELVPACSTDKTPSRSEPSSVSLHLAQKKAEAERFRAENQAFRSFCAEDRAMWSLSGVLQVHWSSDGPSVWDDNDNEEQGQHSKEGSDEEASHCRSRSPPRLQVSDELSPLEQRRRRFGFGSEEPPLDTPTLPLTVLESAQDIPFETLSAGPWTEMHKAQRPRLPVEELEETAEPASPCANGHAQAWSELKLATVAAVTSSRLVSSPDDKNVSDDEELFSTPVRRRCNKDKICISCGEVPAATPNRLTRVQSL